LIDDKELSMMSDRRSILRGAVLLAGAWALGACGPAEPPAPAAPPPALAPAPPPEPRIPVVATFSILGDIVANVGGERIELTTLVGPDGDAHVYTPTPADAKALAGARVVFVNGLQFEGWIDKLIKASGYTGPVVTVTDGIKPIRVSKGHRHGHGHGHAHGHDHGEFDPHTWQSLAHVRVYVEHIARALAEADPKHADGYRQRAAQYLKRIDELEAHAKAVFAKIPAERRRVLVDHDAFAYLGQAFGVEFFPVRGVSTAAEPSAKDVARLITQARRQKVSALFVENITDPRLVEQFAREAGVKVAGVLHSDALSARDPAAATFLDLYRSNVDRLAAALTP
jgi:zinc/manganese transport system substrate-binding protein